MLAATAVAAIEVIVPSPVRQSPEVSAVEVHRPNEAKHPVAMRSPTFDEAAPIAMAPLVELTLEPVLLPHLPNPPARALARAKTETPGNDPEPLPLTAVASAEPLDADPVLAAASVDPPRHDERVYIPQISDSVRAAYIAQVTSGATEQQLAVRVGDEVIGAVRFQIADGHVSVHIGQVLDLFEGRMDSARFAALRSSPAAQEFVSIEKVRGAGIPLRYDAAYDELVLASTSG